MRSRLQGEGERAMQTAAECHQYARDCVRWAARSKTEKQRKGFLEMARAWREAALRIDNSSELSTLNC